MLCVRYYRVANGSGLSPNYTHNTVPSNVPKCERGILFLCKYRKNEMMKSRFAAYRLK